MDESLNFELAQRATGETDAQALSRQRIYVCTCVRVCVCASSLQPSRTKQNARHHCHTSNLHRCYRGPSSRLAIGCRGQKLMVPSSDGEGYSMCVSSPRFAIPPRPCGARRAFSFFFAPTTSRDLRHLVRALRVA